MESDVGLSKSNILVIACGALAREILHLKEINRWKHMELMCLPAQLHLTPQRIPSAVTNAVKMHRGGYESVFVAYADCGTGGLLKKTCDDLGIKMLSGPHCYSFFDGNSRFAERGDEEMTSFYLTDFLVRQFDSFVWKPLGLHRNIELRDMYFGNYEQLVYLAQTVDSELDRLAREYSCRLGLTYQRRFTGYGDLRSELADLKIPE